MNIFGLEITREKKKPPTRSKISKTQFGKAMKRYTKERYSQGFSNYNTIDGIKTITTDVIRGLYESTIVNRILNKLASDIVPSFYNIQVVDLEGKRIPEAELLCKQLHAKLSRKEIKQVCIDTLLMGSCVSYKKTGDKGFLEEIFNLDIEKIEPVINDDGELEAWIDKRGDEDIEIPKEEVLFFTWDQDSQDLFGRSIIGPIIHVLHLFLNTELNLSEIVDKFVLPIMAWVVSTDKDEITTERVEQIYQSLMDQYEQGSDLVFTDEVRNEVIGAAKNSFDLVPILHELKETLGIMTIPFQILGGKADNLSSSKVQLQTYLSQINDYQSMITDTLVRDLYRPFLEEQGYVIGEDYLNFYIVFPTISIDPPSDAVRWTLPYLREGLIDRFEARSIMGLSGIPLAIEDIELNDVVGINQAIEEGKARDGKGDPKENNPD